jgi:hypothetical protein
VLPDALHRASPDEVLKFLDQDGRAPERRTAACIHGPAWERLAHLIDERAARLPLPAGCAVIAAHDEHPVRWPDTLAALAVLTKSTDTVWLRDKSPTLASILTGAAGGRALRTRISLLVPDAWAHVLTEVNP